MELWVDHSGPEPPHREEPEAPVRSLTRLAAPPTHAHASAVAARRSPPSRQRVAPWYPVIPLELAPLDPAGDSKGFVTIAIVHTPHNPVLGIMRRLANQRSRKLWIRLIAAADGGQSQQREAGKAAA